MARQHAGVRVLEDFTAACGQCLLPWRKCPVQREEEFEKTLGQVASGCEVLWRAIHQRFVVDHVLFLKWAVGDAGDCWSLAWAGGGE